TQAVGRRRAPAGLDRRAGNRIAGLPALHHPCNPRGAAAAAAPAATASTTARQRHTQASHGEHSQERPRASIPSHRLSPPLDVITAAFARDRRRSPGARRASACPGLDYSTAAVLPAMGTTNGAGCLRFVLWHLAPSVLGVQVFRCSGVAGTGSTLILTVLNT